MLLVYPLAYPTPAGPSIKTTFAYLFQLCLLSLKDDVFGVKINGPFE